MGQHHHLVPRFYLQRWSVGGGAGLVAIRRSTGDVLWLSPKTAAVETDAYAVETPEGGKSYAFEEMLGRVESEAALALTRMLDSWPPSEEDRVSWSMLMALQITRGRDFRDVQNTIVDYVTKTEMALGSHDPAEMRERLRDAGLEATQKELDQLRDVMDHPDNYEIEMASDARLVAAAEIALELLPSWPAGHGTSPSSPSLSSSPPTVPSRGTPSRAPRRGSWASASELPTRYGCRSTRRSFS